MIFKTLSRFYPLLPYKRYPKPQSDSKTNPPVPYENIVIPDLNQSRLYVEKGKEPGKKGKEEEMSVKMPGFVSPDSLNEEGYFTQKAKQQLEELKRRGLEKPNLTNPEKKE